MISLNLSEEIATRIYNPVKRLNQEVINDYQLRSSYAIGHSFFSAKLEELDENS